MDPVHRGHGRFHQPHFLVRLVASRLAGRFGIGQCVPRVSRRYHGNPQTHLVSPILPARNAVELPDRPTLRNASPLYPVFSLGHPHGPFTSIAGQGSPRFKAGSGSRFVLETLKDKQEFRQNVLKWSLQAILRRLQSLAGLHKGRANAKGRIQYFNRLFLTIRPQ